MPISTGMHPHIEAILTTTGVVRSSDHPHLVSALARAKRSGEIVNPLPGIFLPAKERTRDQWLQAVSAWAAPLGVIHELSAAALWLPSAAPAVVHLAHPTLRSRPGVTVTRRLIPPEFVNVISGARFASPAFAAVELAAEDEGRAICEALRLRLVTVAELPEVLGALEGSRGQAARRDAVSAALTNPWSYGELRLQRILLGAGISDWVANRPIRVADGLLFPDVRFRRAKLIVEFDGRSTHEGMFLADRERLNKLGAAGYRVLRFGWEHLDQPDYIVATVRAALRAT